ncbi:MAG: acyl-CoA/acyl-ACP dehydrogenase [Candidatus Rokubacteria bacterium]|nr:acyl-CoA/acyl-ACP dehydrogenase [Candidatus Rokubacteria bacterium]
MDFDLAGEQTLLRETVRRFLDRECPREVARALDEEGRFPRDLYRKMAALGWLGLSIPEKYGGAGGGILDTVLVMEELARRSQALAVGYLLNICFGARTLTAFGSPEQQATYLPRIAAGEAFFCLGLTEPSGGTDALALTTRAEPRDGGFVINGHKLFITGAHVADRIILVARVGPPGQRGPAGLTLFLVDTRARGVEIRPIRTVGNRAAATTEIFLADVEVPAADVLGTVGQGWAQLVHTLNNERISVAAICVGTTQAVFEDTLAYARTRTAFGKPIGQFQAIQHYLADMATGLETARLLTRKAAWLQDRGRPCDIEATMAKLHASETAQQAAGLGMRIFGGYGYTLEVDIQRHWRDTQLFVVAPISNEMARNYLAQRFGLPPSY